MIMPGEGTKQQKESTGGAQERDRKRLQETDVDPDGVGQGSSGETEEFGTDRTRRPGDT
jgi:hypothetical protein